MHFSVWFMFNSLILKIDRKDVTNVTHDMRPSLLFILICCSRTIKGITRHDCGVFLKSRISSLKYNKPFITVRK